MKVVFMGTPAFAIPSLDILINSGHEVVGVITATDKMGGRGNKQLIESAVKKHALQHNLKILQPKNLKSSTFIEELKALNAELQVVIAFRMLPEIVWNMPKHGTINLHGSLLPKYRGAAPLNWALINGDSITGVTSFKLKHAIDTGDMILQEEMEIKDSDNVGTLHDRMMHLAAMVIGKTVNMIASNNLKTNEQDESLVSSAPKLNRENCQIDFDKPTLSVHNHIRGLSPFPVAWTNLPDGKDLKVYASEVEIINHSDPIGSYHSDDKNYLKVATQDGYIKFLDIKMAGKRRMKVKDFLNGFKLC